jgi:hypothetical protein
MRVISRVKIIKTFLIEDFSCLAPVSMTLGCEYLCEFSQKYEMALTECSWARRKLIHERKPKSRISWHCPFNVGVILGLKSGFSGLQDQCELYIYHITKMELNKGRKQESTSKFKT